MRALAIAIGLASAVLAGAYLPSLAESTDSFTVTSSINKECSMSSLSDLEFTNLTAGSKVTGEFTYTCNFSNGPTSISISSTHGAMVPDAMAAASGASAIPYGICLRGAASGIRCDNEIGPYASITQAALEYARANMFLDASTPGVAATATFGAQLQANVPNIAGHYSDVVTFQLNP